MEALEYFNELDKWTGRHLKKPHKNTSNRIRRSESVRFTDEACFSQIELNRILSNK